MGEGEGRGGVMYVFLGGGGEGGGGVTDIKTVTERKSISQCTEGLLDRICGLAEFCTVRSGCNREHVGA